MTKQQLQWKLSSSSLRMILRHWRYNNPEFRAVEQFQWINLNLGGERMYLYNVRSGYVLASVRYMAANKFYVRYHKHSRYSGILATWAKSLPGENTVVASNRLSRWERRVNRGRSAGNHRRTALIGVYVNRMCVAKGGVLPPELRDNLTKSVLILPDAAQSPRNPRLYNYNTINSQMWTIN